LLVQYLFGNGILTGLALVEELLPGTDFIPTATIGWVLTYGRDLEEEGGGGDDGGSGDGGGSQPPATRRVVSAREKSPAERKIEGGDFIDV